VLKRGGNFADLDSEDKSQLRSLGLHDPDTQVWTCVKGSYEPPKLLPPTFYQYNLSPLFSTPRLKITFTSPQAALVRAFKHPGGFAELSDEDRKILAAAGLPPGSKVWIFYYYFGFNLVS
jgi:hypothetical protein